VVGSGHGLAVEACDNAQKGVKFKINRAIKNLHLFSDLYTLGRATKGPVESLEFAFDVAQLQVDLTGG
jgi:hypothetical protein